MHKTPCTIPQSRICLASAWPKGMVSKVSQWGLPSAHRFVDYSVWLLLYSALVIVVILGVAALALRDDIVVAVHPGVELAHKGFVGCAAVNQHQGI